MMMEDDIYFMKLAIKEAKRAYDIDDTPIGCVIVYNDKVISRAYNRKEVDNVATYHAEVLAINQACLSLNTWRLEGCTLYTTVEPCMMCTGAIIQSRISRVVYGASNDSFGYLSKLDNSKIDIVGGVLDRECSLILGDFFKKQRDTKKVYC